MIQVDSEPEVCSLHCEKQEALEGSFGGPGGIFFSPEMVHFFGL